MNKYVSLWLFSVLTRSHALAPPRHRSWSGKSAPPRSNFKPLGSILDRKNSPKKTFTIEDKDGPIQKRKIDETTPVVVFFADERVERRTTLERSVDRWFSNLDYDSDGIVKRQEGSIASATALVCGTSVGAGILALPAVSVSAGCIPSSTVLFLCWLYMVSSGLLLAEVWTHPQPNLSLALLRSPRSHHNRLIPPAFLTPPPPPPPL